jgi:uncharacterized membrane protein (Fun14 family)
MTMDIVSVFGPPVASFCGGGVAGAVIGYTVKKIAKIAAVVVGLFFVALSYMDFKGWVKVDWNTVSNQTQAAATTGFHQVTTMLNHTAIQVQQHVAGSGVNEISLIPITAAVGFLPGLAYGWSKG